MLPYRYAFAEALDLLADAQDRICTESSEEMSQISRYTMLLTTLSFALSSKRQGTNFSHYLTFLYLIRNECFFFLLVCTRKEKVLISRQLPFSRVSNLRKAWMRSIYNRQWKYFPCKDYVTAPRFDCSPLTLHNFAEKMPTIYVTKVTTNR